MNIVVSDRATDCIADSITEPHLLLQTLVTVRKVSRFGVVLQEGGRALAEQPVRSAMNCRSSSESRSKAEAQWVKTPSYTVLYSVYPIPSNKKKKTAAEPTCGIDGALLNVVRCQRPLLDNFDAGIHIVCITHRCAGSSYRLLQQSQNV